MADTPAGAAAPSSLAAAAPLIAPLTATAAPRWLGLLAPPLLVAVCILLLGDNVYMQDEWDAIAARLLALRDGQGLLPVLWAPHNEHRLLLPNLVFVLLHGRAPHLLVGMLLSVAVMGVTFARLYRELLRPALAASALPAGLGVLFSLLFFSFGQKENLFFNFQLAWALEICGLVHAALGLSQKRRLWFWGGLAVAFACSAHWVALLPLVLVDGTYRTGQAAGGRARRDAALAAAGRVAALLLLLRLYLAGGPRASVAAFLQHAVSHPLQVAEYVLRLLGNVHFWHGIGATSPLAPLGGALFLGLLARLLWRRELQFPEPALYLILVMLALVALICIGRAGLGTLHALDSRYQACTLFGWLALLSVVLRRAGRQAWGRWLVLGCLLNVALASASALRVRIAFDHPTQRRALECQRALLHSGQPLDRPGCAGLVYSDPARQQELTLALRAHNLL